MKTMIMNGSPKAERGNTEIFMRKLMEGMQEAAPIQENGQTTAICDVCYTAKEDYEQLAQKLQAYDEIIIVFPLYVHAMPGSVRKVMEYMKSAEGSSKRLGFVIQYGFVEGAQSKYVTRYLESFTRKLHYESIGIAVHGGSAGVCEMPEKMNRKLFEQLKILGKSFVETGKFSKEAIATLSIPYELSGKQAKRYELMAKLGVSDSMWWNMQLKRNGAMKHRYDRPFA